MRQPDIRIQQANYFLVFSYYIALLIIASLTLNIAWVGFISSDDTYYIQSALGWLHNFPYIATHFGTIRTGVAIPIALMMALFGESEFTATLSSCLFYLATACLTLAMLARIIGYNAAFLASVVFATIPLFAITATIPSDDWPELFFMASSFWLFWLACQTNNRLWLLILAGVSAACGFLAHELITALLLFYGILFVFGFGLKRREYWLMATGFLAVIAAECTYYWFMTGDPLYRFNMVLKATGNSDRAETGFLQISTSGTLHIWAPIDPIVMFFSNHYFSLLGFLVIPTMWWIFVKDRQNQSHAATVARLLLGLGIVWIIVSGIVLQNVKLLPRYYTGAAYCVYVASAVLVYAKAWLEHKKLVILGIVGFLVVNFALILANNKNPRFAERALVEYLGQSQETISTDPLTASNIEYFCRWMQQDCKRVTGTPPVAGKLYFYNPTSADRPNRLVPLDKVKQYVADKQQWQQLWEKRPPRKTIAVIAERLGITPILPKVLISKLEGPNTSVFVYRLPE